MSTSVNELLQGFMSNDIATTSTLKLRDEKLQVKQNRKRIKKLKKETKKKSKLLFPTNLSIPFNPFTGAEDENYNRNVTFRPLKAEHTVALAIKKYINDNMEEGSSHHDEAVNAKSVFMTKAGVEAWDTSDTENLTDEDRRIFKRYRVPLIFTLNVVKVDIPTFTNSPYGREYLVSVKRDPLTGEVVGEYPVPLQVHKLMSDLVSQSISELDDDIKSGKIVLNDKDRSAKIKELYKDIVVSSDYPSNYALAVEIPLDSKYGIPESFQLKGLEDDDMFKNLVLVKQTVEVRDSLNKYISGEFDSIDYYDNFWELNMSCPSDTEDPKEIGQKTRYEASFKPFKDVEGNVEFGKAVENLLNSELDFERIFMGSAYVVKFTDELVPNFLDAVSLLIPVDDSRFTASVIRANKDIITLIYGDEGMDLIASAEGGIVEEGKLDEKMSKEVSKMSVDVNQILADNAVEDVETEEINMDFDE